MNNPIRRIQEEKIRVNITIDIDTRMRLVRTIQFLITCGRSREEAFQDVCKSYGLVQADVDAILVLL